MKSYPFTSRVTYDSDGMPLYDRAVDSDFLRSVNRQYFSDGVFYDGQSNRMQVVADTGMQVKVLPGSVHIQGAIGIETEQRTLVMQASGGQDRIDTVVARLDLSLAVRSIDLYVAEGTPAQSPQPPALTRDSTIWELGLANIFIPSNSTVISQQRITDTRLDPARCGQVGAPVQPPFDTAAYFVQLRAQMDAEQAGFAEWFERIKGQLSEDAAGHLQVQLDNLAEDVQIFACTLLADGWTETPATETPPAAYTQTASCPGLLAAYDLEAPQVPSTGVQETDAALKEGLDALCEAGNSGEVLAGQLKWTCYGSPPTVDLPLRLRRAAVESAPEGGGSSESGGQEGGSDENSGENGGQGGGSENGGEEA